MPTEQDFVTYKQFVESLDDVNPSESDKAVLNAGENGPKSSLFSAIAAFVHNKWAAFVHACTAITSFASGDTFSVCNPTDGTRKMSKDTLLTLTSQNALAGNVAQAFDPTRTSENPYPAGYSVTYTDGKVYTFKVPHYGAWTGTDVDKAPVTSFVVNKNLFIEILFSSENSQEFTFVTQESRGVQLLDTPVSNGSSLYLAVTAGDAGTYKIRLHATPSATSEYFTAMNDTVFAANETKFVKAHVTGTTQALKYIAVNGAITTAMTIKYVVLNGVKKNVSEINAEAYAEYKRQWLNFSSQVSLTSGSNTTLALADKFKEVGFTYCVKITSSADTSFIFALSTGGSASNITESYGDRKLYAGAPIYIAFAPTLSYARFFFQNPTASATIDVECVKFAYRKEDFSDTLSPLVDKGGSIVWNSGHYINDSGQFKDGSVYSYITPIQVRKGDLIYGTHSKSMSGDRCGVYVTDGNGTFYYFKCNMLDNGVYFYIADEDCLVTFNKKNDAVVTLHWFSMPVYSNLDKFFDKCERFYPSNEIENKLKCLSGNTLVGSQYGEKPVTLLHFSDIHAGRLNMDRIQAFRTKFASYLSDTICTGDMAGAKFTEYPSDFWNATGPDTILQLVGNHDVYDAHNQVPGTGTGYDDPQYWATAAEKYAQYMANVSKWGVTQPSGASENGLCYYYKDYDLTTGADIYTTSAMRLIVLDGMAFDAAQLAWLVATLEDARTNGIPVMIADHFAPINYAADIDKFDTPFCSFNIGMKEQAFANGHLPGACGAVDDFITAGGEFVCWICGHLHYDVVGTVVSHPNQIFIAIGSAKYKTFALDSYRLPQFKSADLFNIFIADVRNKRISVMRVGADTDNWMRPRHGMTIDYSSKTLVSTW